jgi:hypothetical protein
VQHQLALSLGFILAIENFQLTRQAFEDLLSIDAVKLCLLGIVGNHIAAPAGAFTGKDFFDVKIVGNDFKASRCGQRRFIEMIAAELFTQYVLASAALQNALIFLAAHAAVHHPDYPAQVPAVQVFLYLIDALAVVLIARQHPAAHGDALAGDRKTDGYLGQIIALLLGFAVGLQIRRPRLIDLEIGVGGIEKDQIDGQVEQIGRGPEYFFLYGFAVLEQKIHGTVKVLDLQRWMVAKIYLFGRPLFDGQL